MAAMALCICTGLVGQTLKDAELFVKEAVTFVQANSREAFLAEVNKPTGRFNFATTKTLYISVYDLDCKVLAHGASLSRVGTNASASKDADGKLFVKDRIDLAKSKGKGIVEYVEVDPATKAREHKTSYIELVNGMVVSCGVYAK
jgi:signal transduction histidine kinase